MVLQEEAVGSSSLEYVESFCSFRHNYETFEKMWKSFLKTFWLSYTQWSIPGGSLKTMQCAMNILHFCCFTRPKHFEKLWNLRLQQNPGRKSTFIWKIGFWVFPPLWMTPPFSFPFTGSIPKSLTCWATLANVILRPIFCKESTVADGEIRGIWYTGLSRVWFNEIATTSPTLRHFVTGGVGRVKLIVLHDQKWKIVLRDQK